ncbi:MAG TPA: 3-phosphoshikimate 1-carboxyvinyltransferase [Firmicutes bacterium]|nr:3-phosphoshikimate 1-carboxyvinyltransferase [Bacillota bacterium]
MSDVEIFNVPVSKGPLHFIASVPGSKSITNRALLIAALAQGRSILKNVLFSDDSWHFMDSLKKLGFQIQICENDNTVTVDGQSGKIPFPEGEINVGSAGTAARFLTALLALSTGRYVVQASTQMMARPMKPLLDPLTNLGVQFEFLQKQDYLPYIEQCKGLRGGSIRMDASQSSQFLSALLLVGCYGTGDLEITLEGALAARPYIEMTIRMMHDFGVQVQVPQENFQRFIVPYAQRYQGMDYTIEPDASNASYFWAMAVLTGGSVLLKGIRMNSLQGDIGFLNVLRRLGSQIEERENGIWLEGPKSGTFPGIDIDLGGMPDQTMTLAALAPFATSPTHIRNVSLIKYHESNRIAAIINELARLGIASEETSTGILIYPGTPKPAAVETYQDHRMAMAFSLIGLRVPGIQIKNPDCTAKTFKGFFQCFQETVETGNQNDNTIKHNLKGRIYEL